MHYRDVLYSDYSTAFSGQKQYDPTVQYASYEATYELQSLQRDLAIFDVGCGKGEWLAWMSQKGFRSLHGTDFSPSDVAVAIQQLPHAQVVQGDATEQLRQRGGQLDVVHAKDVIEHMTKDEFIHFLQAAHAALRPGGRIWLRSFNAQAPLSGMTRYGDFTHESGHTPSSLAQCLRATGFTQVKVKGQHYCSTALQGRLRALLSWPVKQLARLLLKLRHGSGSHGEVDLFAAEPDLFAEAVK